MCLRFSMKYGLRENYVCAVVACSLLLVRCCLVFRLLAPACVLLLAVRALSPLVCLSVFL